MIEFFLNKCFWRDNRQHNAMIMILSIAWMYCFHYQMLLKVSALGLTTFTTILYCTLILSMLSEMMVILFSITWLCDPKAFKDGRRDIIESAFRLTFVILSGFFIVYAPIVLACGIKFRKTVYQEIIKVDNLTLESLPKEYKDYV